MKDVLNIQVPKGTELAVVGDIHEHPKQFRDLLERIQPSPKRWFYSVGDIWDKGFGPKYASEITKKFRSLEEQGIGGLLKGNHELKQIREAQQRRKMNSEFRWLETQPLVRSFVFPNGSRITLMHGGVTPAHSWEDFNIDVGTSFIRDLNAQGRPIRAIRVPGTKETQPTEPGGRSWHEIYDGRFGYIVAGHHPQKDGIPKYYNYSCNLDTACYQTGILTCQIFNESGRVETIKITGDASYPLNRS
jgi:hypothetical protein